VFRATLPPRAAGIAAGALADALLGDPRRGHPVALFGSAAAALERLSYADDRPRGIAHVGVLLTALAALGVAGERTRGPARALLTAATVFVALGGTSLARTGTRMADHLDAGDVDAARALLPSLCGRDPAALDETGLARAALESVAENTSDATVAPLFWAAVAGTPGTLVYRGANTLDAMIGHRSPRYARFGWAAARFDDVLNFLPARLTGLLVAVCAPLVGGSPVGALRAWGRDAGRHPSPNAGERGLGHPGVGAGRSHPVRPSARDPAHPRRRAAAGHPRSAPRRAALACRAGRRRRGGRGQRRRPYRSASFSSVVSGTSGLAAALSSAAFSRRRCCTSAYTK
jgi:adenosylcobinamide-phosphate synthase